MFEGSLVESTTLLKARNRWPTVISVAIQAAIAATIIAVPLLHPEAIKLRAPMMTLIAPPPRPPQPPPPPRPRVRMESASSSPHVGAHGTRYKCAFRGHSHLHRKHLPQQRSNSQPTGPWHGHTKPAVQPGPRRQFLSTCRRSNSKDGRRRPHAYLLRSLKRHVARAHPP
jgi:hypothetical protein